MTEHVKSKRKVSTAREYQRIATLYIVPRLGRHRISEIKRQDVAKLHHELSSKPYQANRTLALLSKFFNWAEKHGLRAGGSNPCRHVEKYTVGSGSLAKPNWQPSGTPCEQRRAIKVQRLGQLPPSVCSRSLARV